jgi:hypothetical protein
VDKGGRCRQGHQTSKGERVDKFHEGKTQKRASEETGGLAQSDRGEEGPLLGGQSLQTEELGAGQNATTAPSTKSTFARTGLRMARRFAAKHIIAIFSCLLGCQFFQVVAV